MKEIILLLNVFLNVVILIGMFTSFMWLLPGSPSNITPSPTKFPTRLPTKNPTTLKPTLFPTLFPTTRTPTKNPTNNPTRFPTTKTPTGSPTKNPTRFPTPPTSSPTKNPTRNPTLPTSSPTKNPTGFPTNNPTRFPTKNPTNNPTRFPTKNPTRFPTNNPTRFPTNNPTRFPTNNPTRFPTNNPTRFPTPPTNSPTTFSPTNFPTTPTKSPTKNPTNFPVVAQIRLFNRGVSATGGSLVSRVNVNNACSTAAPTQTSIPCTIVKAVISFNGDPVSGLASTSPPFPSSTPVRNPAGVEIATSWTDLLSNGASPAIAPSPDYAYWTGSTPTGDYDSSQSCSNWVSGSPTTGAFGYSGFTGNNWVRDGIVGCDTILDLLCLCYWPG